MLRRITSSVERTESSPASSEDRAESSAKDDPRRPSRARPWATVARLILIGLAAAFLLIKPTPANAAGNPSRLGMSTDPPLDLPHRCDRNATVAKGQKLIDQRRYQQAVDVFTCAIFADPLSLDAFRGRAEAKLMLNRYSDAFRDYVKITAFIVPVQPDAFDIIAERYDARLARHPNDVAALTGAAFVHWTRYDFGNSLPHLEKLLDLNPTSVFAHLFLGSSRLFLGEDISGGRAELQIATYLAPYSPDVRYIYADAYTYAQPDGSKALPAAQLAFQWGLDTPRVHAILAAWYFASGDTLDGAMHLKHHFDLVTTETVHEVGLAPNSTVELDFVGGRVYDFPLPMTAGQSISLRTTSENQTLSDSIMVILKPDGTAITGNDDFIDYYAGLDWTAPATGTYHLLVTTFEAASTGQLELSRDLDE